MDLYNAALGQEAEDEPMELTLEQYEEAKAHYNGIIARGEAAKRLAENPDFKLLVMEGYLTNEPRRLADLMSSGRLNNQLSIDGVQRDLLAVGSFRTYMKSHTDEAHIAVMELASLEEAREIALAEEAGEEVAPDPLGR